MHVVGSAAQVQPQCIRHALGCFLKICPIDSQGTADTLLQVRPLMMLSEQVAILLEAAELELLQPEDIVRWADQAIVAMQKPPVWVIDLSLLRSPHLVDFVGLLRLHAAVPLALRRRIQIVVLAHITGVLSLADTLPKLFRVAL